MLKRILGGEVRDKHGKSGIRKCRRKRKYMEEKGRDVGKYAGGGTSRILGGEVWGIEGSVGGKGSTGMWNETEAKITIVGGERGRRVKAQEG